MNNWNWDNYPDFTEFAEMFLETRREEFDKLGLRLQFKCDLSSPKEVEKLIIDVYQKALTDSNNLTLMTLQFYHTWLMKQIIESNT